MVIKAFGIEIEICKGSRRTMVIDGREETVVFVRREDCHKAHEDLTAYLNERFNVLNTTIQSSMGMVNKRVDDALGSLDNYVQLLRAKNDR